MVSPRPKERRLRRSGHPGGLRCDRHRHGSRPAARPRWPPLEYLLLSKRTRQVLETAAGTAWEAVEPADIGTHFGRSASNTSQIVCSTNSGMAVRLGVGDAFIEQPGIQLLEVLNRSRGGRSARAPTRPGSRLVPSSSPTPACRQPARPGNGCTSEGSGDCRGGPCRQRSHPPPSLHVVVDAAPTGALEQGKGPVVGIEHHLLRLSWIGSHEQHAAVAEPHMGDLHGHRHPTQQDDLVAPVKLIGLPRRKAPAPAQTPPPSSGRATGPSSGVAAHCAS